jgi:hypothetical protein
MNKYIKFSTIKKVMCPAPVCPEIGKTESSEYPFFVIGKVLSQEKIPQGIKDKIGLDEAVVFLPPDFAGTTL